jgi:hypothetical protein
MSSTLNERAEVTNTTLPSNDNHPINDIAVNAPSNKLATYAANRLQFLLKLKEAIELREAEAERTPTVTIIVNGDRHTISFKKRKQRGEAFTKCSNIAKGL